MGIARLLAKGWVVFCLFAGAHALRFALVTGTEPLQAASTVGICTALFVAMGLLFIGGYAAGTDHGGPFLTRFKPQHLVPGFNELVFVGFVALSFADQAFFAPEHMQNTAIDAIKAAVSFAVPGQRALDGALAPCGLDGGRIFASALAWLLAIIYLASAASRLRLAAALIRIERSKRPEALGPTLLALVLGVAAVVGIQLLYVGSAYGLLPCSAYTDISGALLVGLAPLLLVYLVLAACANLLATGPE